MKNSKSVLKKSVYMNNILGTLQSVMIFCHLKSFWLLIEQPCQCQSDVYFAEVAVECRERDIPSFAAMSVWLGFFASIKMLCKAAFF